MMAFVESRNGDGTSGTGYGKGVAEITSTFVLWYGYEKSFK